jgi:hypothetical protein
VKYVGKDGLIINGSEVWHKGNFDPASKVDKAEFDNLEIGGRNLILNSDFSQGLTNWTKTSNAISLEVGGGYRGDGLRLVITTAGTVTPRQRINLELMANDTLTGQVKVKTIQGNFSNMLMRVANQLTIPLVSVKQLDNDWELYTYRVTVSSPITLSNHFGFYNTTGEFIIDEIQLERGNKATDWTPAPEDIQAEIEKKADKTELPTKLSQLTKDINFDERYYTETEVNTKLDGKVDNSRVLTDVPANAKFTDTITTINNKTGAISKADIVALGIPSQDTNTTYTAGEGLILTGTVFTPDFGTGAGKVVQGDDSRLSDARTPKPHNHTKSEITDFPTLSSVATSGNYNDLTNKPTIPTDTSQLSKTDVYTKTEVNNLLSSAGQGDMVKAIYDTNNNGIVDNAEKVNGFTVETNVPANAKFTDTTYSEITTSEIDAGTSSTLRTISGRRIKYILDKVQGWINALTKADVGLGNVDNIKQASKTEFDAHLADSVKHITSAERNSWNSKAEGSHSHSGVYEPVFTKNNAFNKNFGTTAGTVCQGNDSRLSNSRKCNNTFDNVATARTNLGLTGSSNTTHYHDGRYISKTNTTVFTPTADYHPATKKYVDDNAGGDIYHVGTSPPSDSNLFWVDTSE